MENLNPKNDRIPLKELDNARKFIQENFRK